MEKEKCKKCGSENIIMVEYDNMNPEHYDGEVLGKNLEQTFINTVIGICFQLEKILE